MQENVDLVNIIKINELPPSPGTQLNWLGVVARPDTGQAYRDTWEQLASVIANEIGSVTTPIERFYLVGGTGEFDPADGDTFVSDPNLDGLDYDLMKWGVGDIRKGTDWQNDVEGGGFTILGSPMSFGEMYVARPRPKVSNILSSTDAVARFTAGIKTVQASGTMLTADFRKLIILASTTTTMTYTIKAASVYPANVLLRIMTGTGAQKQSTILIEGGASFNWGGDSITALYLGQKHTLDLISDGTQWYVMDKTPERAFGTPRLGPMADINELPADGGQYLRIDYPDAWAKIQALAAASPGAVKSNSEWDANPTYFGSGNGTTTFRMPRWYAMQFRALDPSGSIDTDRATAVPSQSNMPGSYQADLVGPLTIKYNMAEKRNDTDGNGAEENKGGKGPGWTLAASVLQNNGTAAITAGSGVETRPKNVGLFVYVTLI
ncbi:hypothetical protein DCC81_24810 [Chitinophaga parva]|uniref:Uncharacterized protein n=1 Tax=Chitinophaga parva TaxID=2169414 RepID=A0A2T7BBN8_9BACT|nr:hypothetical protein [Chitinophaga parva]PUZ21812.1 hypothetical protein DCC81_24810 [Chitinophaga parva]